MIFSRLRTRMIAHIVWIVTTVTFITLLISIIIQQRSLQQHLEDDVEAFSGVIKKTLMNAMLHKQGLESINSILPDFEYVHHIRRVRILDFKGNIKASSRPDELGKTIRDSVFVRFLHSTKTVEKFSRINGEFTVFTEYSRIANRKPCQSCHDARQPYLGILWMETSEHLSSGWSQASSTLILGIGLGIIILLSLVTISLFVRAVDRPIQEIVQAVRRMSEGDYSARITRVFHNEFDQLADGINALAHRLQAAKSRLLEVHDREIREAQARARIGDRAASVAHEIKHPISGIIFAANSLLKDFQNHDERKEILAEIVRQAHNVERNLEELLGFTDETRLDFHPVQLNDLIERILLLLKDKLEEMKIEVERHLDPSLPRILADPSQIEQTLFNLLMNAMQAIEEDGRKQGRIEIQTLFDKEKGNVVLTIADNGPGIPEEYHDKIFRPFFTTKKSGTGLGLSTCQEIILRHGGSISFESEPGKGTVFRIELPVQRFRRLTKKEMTRGADDRN
jgi:signal transduction histidine kinase